MSFRSLLELDARLSNQLLVAEKPGILRNFAAFLAHSGDSWFWALALILGWFFSNSAWKQWEVVEFFGILGLAGVVLVIKFLVRRERPQGEWGSIYRNTDPHSFPSGHAARSFLIAIIASAFGPMWLAAILWVWAPLVALARVSMGVHYLSDVAAGAALGVIVALIGLQIYQPMIGWLITLIGFPLW
ncbi:MAG: phosphatase PAP2 family protein [Anaerolineales bacterium]|nr:phosphatase PAP2 family protein [Anaerolineales bacterium]